MKILFAVFDSAADFLDRLQLDTGDGVGALRVKTKARYDQDETIIVEIGFPGLPNRILTRARFGGASGEDVDLHLCDGEEDKRDFLLAVASGRATASWKRRHRRFPMKLPARFVVEGTEEQEVPLRGDAEIEDVGSGGVSLKTGRTLPDGARVTIVLDPLDGSDEIEFTGRVVWNRKDDAVSGIGVQFDTLGGEEMKRLRHMIRDIKLKGVTAE